MCVYLHACVCVCVCLCEYHQPNFLTDMRVSSEKSYSCVPENRQGDKIAIPVRYAPVNCSSVHHLFSCEGSFFSHPILTSLLKAWFEKRSFGVSREATGEQIPADTQKKNSFKRGLQYHGELYKGEKCND